jgi:hypothetical protein
MAQPLVAQTAGAGAAGMQVAGEDHVHLAGCEVHHRHVGASHDVAAAGRVFRIERMMGHQHPQRIAGPAKPVAGGFDLLLVDAAVFPGERAGGVEAQHGDFPVHVPWLQIVGDIAPVVRQRRQPAGKDVEQRHIVIAGHDDRFARQGFEIVAGRDEFMPAGALGDVTGHRQHVGPQVFQRIAQRRQRGGLDTAKVEVGDMRDGSH